MAYSSGSGLGVNNQYGPRQAVGVKGELELDGYEQVFVVNLDGAGPTILFPVLDGSAYITGIDTTFVTGTVTDADIGAVDIDTATAASPINIPDANTGVVTQTGGTAGNLIIKYKKALAHA